MDVFEYPIMDDSSIILMLNKYHPKVDDSFHQFMDISSRMILIINLWMILMLDKHHPKVDDSCHQFMEYGTRFIQ